MFQFEIVLSPDVSIEQQECIHEQLKEFEIPLWQQESVPDPIIVGAVIITISFAAKSFFDGFISEIGKETYIWLKTKIGMKNAQEKKQLKVEYQIIIGNILFSVERCVYSEERHDKILHLVDAIYTILENDKLSKVTSVDIVFDEALEKYTEARCYDTQVRGFIDGKPISSPIRTIAL